LPKIEKRSYKKMKKILIVTDAWRPQVNGAVRVVEAHVRELERMGYEVALIEPRQFKTIAMPLYPEIPVALLPGRKVAELIDAHKPDAIHIVTEGSIGYAARRYCVRNNIPFTTWYHTHFQLYFDMRVPGLLRLVSWYLRRFHKPSERTMASTPTLKQSLEGMGFSNMVVVPLGVDTERFVRNQKLEPLVKPVYMYFGRLAPEKSPEEFLQLKLTGTKLVIGDGPQRAKLERKYISDDVLFVGYKQGQELVDWISRADVFVFPSRTETFGLVTLEAMSCGIPVAAHDVMGPRDVITEGKDGYLDEDLAVAAQKALSLKSEDCRAKALQYTWQHSTEEFVKQLAWIEKK
jgi:glycosyltransferase involved in cell wall biosynthesis